MQDVEQKILAASNNDSSNSSSNISGINNRNTEL